MKRILAYFALFLTSFGYAQSLQPVEKFSWETLPSLPSRSSIVTYKGRQSLKIENTNDAPLQVTLLNIAKPKISSPNYAVGGQIKYDGVQDAGYLELLNYFPAVAIGQPEGQYFSRTLGDSGEMGKIIGSSDWRSFLLPFDSTGANGGPAHLQINLVLKGRGTVYLGPLTLSQINPAASTVRRSEPAPWWSKNAGSWIGGGLGSLLGCLGLITGLLCQKPQYRVLTFGLWKALIVLGLMVIPLGLAALLEGQPLPVWLPLLLMAFLLVTIYASLLINAGKSFRNRELRRMQSLDVPS